MAIELVKRGQSVDLLKKDPNLELLRINLGWDTQKYDGREDFDLDVSVFALDDNGKCQSERDMVFYHPQHQLHPSGAIKHSGDERKGAKAGDDEWIEVDLKKLPSYVKRVVAVITIYDAKLRKQNFGQVSNSYARIDNAQSKEQLYKYDLGEDFSVQTAVKVCEVYRYNDTWKFKAIGDGYESGLAEFVEEFGLNVQGERK